MAAPAGTAAADIRSTRNGESDMASRANDAGSPGRDRDKYRDNDDVRDPIPPDDRLDTNPDTKTEARGDTRENVGNTAQDTDAHPTGPEGTDTTQRER
jgi:hypothetical protein